MAERQIIELGSGNAVVAFGTHEGMPALFFLSESHDGDMGTEVPAEQAPEVERRIMEQGTIIRFATPEAVFRHLDDIESLVRGIAEAQGVEV